MKIRKKIGDLGKEQIQQLVQDFLDELDEGAVALLEHFEESDNPEFLEVEVDAEQKILSFTRKDGSHYAYNLSSETIDALAQALSDLADEVHNIPQSENFENIEDIEGRLQIGKDKDGKIFNYRKPDGTLVENVGIKTNNLELTQQGMSDFQQALKDAGFNSGYGNWSDYISNDGDNPLHLPIPELAFVNIISSFTLTNLNKKGYNNYSKEGVNYDIPTQIEYWDNMGNYFKKWTIMSGQGASTMTFPKKSIAFDLFDSEVGGDALKIKFGDWVPQDSFHFKAFYNDFYKGLSFCSYHIAEEVAQTRNVLEDVQWKRALYPKYNFDSNVNANAQIDDMTLQLGTEGKCQPDGFPCIVYQNGEFYGMYVLSLKKNRDNYVQKKSKANHIHIDGQYYSTDSVEKHLFDGIPTWSAFEVRNPKNLVYATAHYDREADANTYKYDADLPGQFEIAGNSDGSSTYDTFVQGTIYQKDKIVKYTISGKSHLFLNTTDDNTAVPVIQYDSAKDEYINGDDNPDFKNKTHCGWLNVTNTVKVKESIINMSTRLAEIEAAATTEDKKGLIEQYFDIDSLIDYELIQCAVVDVDAVFNNCQWLTWDGVKWFACEYDKDDTFGVLTSLSGVRDEGGWAISLWNNEEVADHSPFGLVRKYYQQEAAERWHELVEKGIFTTEHFIKVITDWTKRFGADFYKKEAKKWPESYCNKDTTFNDEYWKYVKEEYNTAVSAYNSGTSYTIGDKCATTAIAKNISTDGKWSHVFECVKACTGEHPILSTPLGYRGNIGQLYKFIKGNFEKENAFFESLLNN